MLNRLFRVGMRKGLVGGSRPWLVLGGLAGLGKLLGIMARNRPEVVYRGKLEPGQVVVIDHQPAKRSRRRH